MLSPVHIEHHQQSYFEDAISSRKPWSLWGVSCGVQDHNFGQTQTPYQVGYIPSYAYDILTKIPPAVLSLQIGIHD